jgi:AGZA family xanthine/uracil permease-like MFS transporter
MSWLENHFQLKTRGSSVSGELRAAIATFLTMAYILAANPAILSSAGVPFESAVACTALAAGLCCLLMGFYANFPLALASGMGLNAFVAFSIAGEAGSWQTAMGLVVLDGAIILVLVLAGLREAMLDAIPIDLRRAMAAGIGLFIATIGAVNSGIVIGLDGPGPPLGPGSFSDPVVLMTLGGVALTGVLLARKIPGAILIGMVASAGVLLYLPTGEEAVAAASHSASSLWKMPSFDIAFQADVLAACSVKYLPLLLTLLMVDFFDTLGTVTAIGDQADLKDDQNRVLGLRRILIVDSVSASVGGLLGVSSVTSYVESAAGVSEGARTGLHSVFVGVFFLMCVFLAPLAAMIPPAATAPALIVVGFLMCEGVTKIDFTKPDTALPAFVTLLFVPLTYSISHGIGYGILTFVTMRILTLRFFEVHALLYVAAVVFAVSFLLGG